MAIDTQLHPAAATTRRRRSLTSIRLQTPRGAHCLRPSQFRMSYSIQHLPSGSRCRRDSVLRASPARSTVFATGIVDVHHGQLIDIVPGRSRKVLADWLIARPKGWAAGVEVAALDPFRGYSSALSTGLPRAVRVLDPFHVVGWDWPPSTKCPPHNRATDTTAASTSTRWPPPTAIVVRVHKDQNRGSRDTPTKTAIYLRHSLDRDQTKLAGPPTRRPSQALRRQGPGRPGGVLRQLRERHHGQV